MLILDKTSSHISTEALNQLNILKIIYVLIPSGITPECQPSDISVNKKFKDNIKHKFEENRLFY